MISAYRVQHKRLLTGPYLSEPHRSFRFGKNRRWLDWRQGLLDDHATLSSKQHPSWYKDSLIWKLHKENGVTIREDATTFNPDIDKDLMSKYVSACANELDIYKWFNGYWDGLKEYDFELVICILKPEHVIFGDSGKQLIFKREDYVSYCKMPIQLERVEKVLGKLFKRLPRETQNTVRLFGRKGKSASDAEM